MVTSYRRPHRYHRGYRYPRTRRQYYNRLGYGGYGGYTSRYYPGGYGYPYNYNLQPAHYHPHNSPPITAAGLKGTANNNGDLKKYMEEMEKYIKKNEKMIMIFLALLSGLIIAAFLVSKRKNSNYY